MTAIDKYNELKVRLDRLDRAYARNGWKWKTEKQHREHEDLSKQLGGVIGAFTREEYIKVYGAPPVDHPEWLVTPDPRERGGRRG